MPELETQERNDMRNDDFAWIDDQGERHLPINDEAHVRNAIARFGQTEFDDPEAKAEAARRILQAAKRYVISVSDGDDVAKAAKS
jgi:Family of unknown function (DUF6582)